MIDNKELSALFSELSVLLELRGENPFKARAYEQASRIIGRYEGDIAAALREPGARIEGIGAGIAEKIEEFDKTGRIALHSELKDTLPLGMLELLKVPGLGSKRIKVLHDVLGIEDIEQLENACRDNRLAAVEGFGPKSVQKILEGIDFVRRCAQFFMLETAAACADEICKELVLAGAASFCETAGSIRRRCPVVRNINIAACAHDPSAVAAWLKSSGKASDGVVTTRNNIIEFTSDRKIPVSIECCASLDRFGSLLARLTGSLAHLELLKKRAVESGMDIPLSGVSEEQFYSALSLQWIPPELREGGQEVAAASNRALPRLVSREDIKGVLHCHTLWSDGAASVEIMAKAAKDMGFSYIGITDHSASAVYANGLSSEKVMKQWAEIERVEGLLGIKIFKGIEADIGMDGSIDYPDDVAKGFDFIIASVHNRFTMDEIQMTRRIIKALENPYVTMLGHPTGRLLLSREAYKVDMKKVIDAAAGLGKMIEINANPLRLDLDWSLVPYAVQKGVRISINPDAHDPAGLGDVWKGLDTARKGWAQASDIFNTLNAVKAREILMAGRL